MLGSQRSTAGTTAMSAASKSHFLNEISLSLCNLDGIVRELRSPGLCALVGVPGCNLLRAELAGIAAVGGGGGP